MTNPPFLLDADVDLAALGALLKQARRQAGLKQTALAERTGTSERALSRWETGAPRPPTRVPHSTTQCGRTPRTST